MLSHVATPPQTRITFFRVQFCGSYTARVRERQGQCKFRTTLSCGACRTRAHFPWTCRWHPLFRRRRRILVHGLEALLILTEHFCQSPFLLQHKWQMRGPGLRVRLRVVDGDVVYQMIVVDPSDALDDMEGLAVRVPQAVQPRLVVEIHGVGNQSISLPMTDRVAHPQRTESSVMHAAVSKNLMPERIELEKHDDLSRRLNNLHRQWVKKSNREADWSACVVKGI